MRDIFQSLLFHNKLNEQTGKLSVESKHEVKLNSELHLNEQVAPNIDCASFFMCFGCETNKQKKNT